jgi:hypothetical protein
MPSLSDDKKVLRGLPNRRAGKRASAWIRALTFKSIFFRQSMLCKGYVWVWVYEVRTCRNWPKGPYKLSLHLLFVGAVNVRVEVSGRPWEFILP